MGEPHGRGADLFLGVRGGMGLFVSFQSKKRALTEYSVLKLLTHVSTHIAENLSRAGNGTNLTYSAR
jgi:hypothetical protein